MEDKELKLTLVTPLNKIHEDISVEEVRLPGEKGQVTVYPDHSPLVTTLGIGVLSYKEANKSDFEYAAISWGYCEVLKGKVRLLAEEVCTANKIDLDKEKQIKQDCEKVLESNELNPEEIEKKQHELEFAEAKIQVCEHSS